MDHNIKKIIYHNLYKLALITIALCCTLLLATFLSNNAAIETFGFGKQTAKLQIEVVDGASDLPLEGAVIVIPETGERFTTDKNGKTGVIEVPLVEDTRFQNILEKPWGEVTILCYKDGYIPYALFYAQVSSAKTRKGPRIYLFQDDGSSQPFSIIEGPDQAWVQNLLAQYLPSDEKTGGSASITPSPAP